MVSSGTAAARIIGGNAVATLPLGVMAGTATFSVLAGQLCSKHFGRRPVFMTASALGVVGAGLLSLAVHIGSFPLMVVSGVPQGLAYSVSNQYRFAAAESVSPDRKERALALVVGGAVLSALLGPELSRHIRFRLDTAYLGAFLLAIGLWALQFACVTLVDYTLPQRLAQAAVQRKDSVPSSLEDGLAGSTASASEGKLAASPAPSCVHTSGEGADGPRPWYRIFAQAEFFNAAYMSAVSYFVMAGLMSATPLAMSAAGYSVDASTIVIEGHAVAMFLPSFFTGALYKNAGAAIMLTIGSTGLIVGNLLLFFTQDRWVFWVSLILIGSGWNFNYVSASNMVLSTFTLTERFVGLGLFDMLNLSGQSLAMVTVGFTFDGIGWEAMYTVYMAINATVSAMCVVLIFRRCRRSRHQQQDT